MDRRGALDGSSARLGRAGSILADQSAAIGSDTRVASSFYRWKEVDLALTIALLNFNGLLKSVLVRLYMLVSKRQTTMEWRQFQRNTIRRPGEIVYAPLRLPCSILNMSPVGIGVKLLLPQIFPKLVEVRLDFEDAIVPARVRWQNG